MDVPDSAIIGFWHKGFTSIVVNTALWAIYLVLFPISLRALLKLHGLTKANILLGLATLIMFTITNIYYFIYLRFQASIVEVMIQSNSAGVLSNRQRLQLASEGILGSRILQALPKLLNFIIGDCIVVHRAFVLLRVDHSEHPVKVMTLRIFMVLLLLGTTAVALFNTVTTLRLGTKSVNFALNPESNAKIDALSVGLSLLTNLVATLSIGIMTGHRMMETLGAQTAAFKKLLRLLVILMETAVIYCIIQLLAVIAILLPSRGADIGDIFTGGYLSALNFLSALYPTVLIILLGRQNMEKSRGARLEDGSQVTTSEKRLSLTYPASETMHSQWEDDEYMKARQSASIFVV